MIPDDYGDEYNGGYCGESEIGSGGAIVRYEFFGGDGVDSDEDGGGH